MIYGIDCTSREAPTTHTPFFRTRTPLEIAYREAQQEAESKWKQYTEFVDTWLANGNIDTMNEFEELCKQADMKAHVLYKQLHCLHPDTVEFDDHVECTECGRKLLSGKRIV